MNKKISRRNFLKLGLIAAAAPATSYANQKFPSFANRSIFKDVEEEMYYDEETHLYMPETPEIKKVEFIEDTTQAILGERRIHLYNTHTGEECLTTYFSDGAYVPDCLDEINMVLRDHRSNEMVDMDIELLDYLYDIKQKLGVRKPFLVLSGYRSPSTNKMLRKKSKKVAKNSFHMQGRAIDVRLEGVPTHYISRAGEQLRRGGVGYYPKSNFVHLDVGNVRTWRG